MKYDSELRITYTLDESKAKGNGLKAFVYDVVFEKDGKKEKGSGTIYCRYYDDAVKLMNKFTKESISLSESNGFTSTFACNPNQNDSQKEEKYFPDDY